MKTSCYSAVDMAFWCYTHTTNLGKKKYCSLWTQFDWIPDWCFALNNANAYFFYKTWCPRGEICQTSLNLILYFPFSCGICFQHYYTARNNNNNNTTTTIVRLRWICIWIQNKIMLKLDVREFYWLIQVFLQTFISHWHHVISLSASLYVILVLDLYFRNWHWLLPKTVCSLWFSHDKGLSWLNIS